MKWMGGQRKRNLKSNNYFNKKTTYRRQKAFFKNHTNVKPPHIQRSNNDHHVSAKRLLSKRKDSDTRHIIDLENNDGEIYDIVICTCSRSTSNLPLLFLILLCVTSNGLISFSQLSTRMEANKFCRLSNISIRLGISYSFCQ